MPKRLPTDAERILVDKLRARRVSLQMEYGEPFNQQTIASTIGITQGQLSFWETGRSVPRRFCQWEAWARALRMKFTVSLE